MQERQRPSCCSCAQRRPCTGRESTEEEHHPPLCPCTGFLRWRGPSYARNTMKAGMARRSTGPMWAGDTMCSPASGLPRLPGGSLPSVRQQRPAQKQAHTKTGGWEQGHLQGVHFFPVLQRQGNSEYREKTESGIHAAF